MDHKFTQKVVDWLELPKEKRDLNQGALFLLQLSNNQIMYRNISRNVEKHADFIEYQIRKYVKFRLKDLTHEQVVEMQEKVDKIALLRHLDVQTSTSPNTPSASEADTAQGGEASDDASSAAFKSGRRADHDSLPVEIQALYVENASILQKMRELHLRLRTLSVENATCPDSERYPFLKELIALDKQYHKNWQLYDSFDVAKAAEGAEQTLIEDERTAQKNILRQISLTKGRYKKNPSDKLKEQIASLYAQLASPTEKLTAELAELGIIGADHEENSNH